MVSQNKKSKKTAVFAMFIAIAMVLSFIESQLPISSVVPGIRVGLTNLVVLIALYKIGAKEALVINVLRIVLVGITFGSIFSIIYSMAGGLLSGTVMILMKKSKMFSVVTVSLAGGICHNVGQIIVAMLILETKAIIYYLPALWISGMVAGIVVGILGAQVINRLSGVNWK